MKKILYGFLLISCLFYFSCGKKQSVDIDNPDFSGQLSEEEIASGMLTPEILWKFGRLGEFDLSPDGDRIVYTVTRYDAKNNNSITDIYIIPSSGGEAVKLTDSDGSYHNVQWTPDGQRIAYIGMRRETSQIFEMNPDGTGKVKISSFEEGIEGFKFSPDGSKILFITRVKTGQTPQEFYPDLPLTNVRISEDLMYRHWNRWNEGTHLHIFVSAYTPDAIKTGRDIMETEPWDAPMAPYFDQSEISWSNDGRYIAYTCKKMRGKDFALSPNSDIYLYDTEKDCTENITKGMPGYDRYAVFSKDGTHLAWQSMKTPGFEADKDRLFVMELATGKKDYITQNLDQNVSHLAWSEDGNIIYFVSGINATYQIFSTEVNTKNIKQLTSGVHNYVSFLNGKDFLIGSRMTMSMAQELYRIDLITGEEKQISFINKDIYDNIRFGAVEERWVKTTDKKEMLVWVIFPPDFDPEKKYPAVLYCQGGPQSAVSQFFSFRWNFQLMAANGYIVVAPNRRGLPTFGSEWNNQISKDYGGQNIKDYLSAIDALKTEPYIDENRLGAVGASYGGFSVFYLAGHHQGRFKAFISHCGIYNFESMYGSTEELFFVNHDLGGGYWEKPRPKSYDFSPHLFVDKWDTPMLIISGEKDYRIPYTESLQAFNAAQLRGVPSKLLIFPEETHFVLKPQNSILWQREFFGWLDKWLKK